MRLIRKEDVGSFGRVSFAGKSFDSVKGYFKVFLLFLVHLCSLYLGLSLPYLACLFLCFTEQRRIQNFVKHLR